MSLFQGDGIEAMSYQKDLRLADSFREEMSSEIGKMFTLSREYVFYPRQDPKLRSKFMPAGTRFILCQIYPGNLEVLFKVLIGDVFYNLHINLDLEQYEVPYVRCAT